MFSGRYVPIDYKYIYDNFINFKIMFGLSLTGMLIGLAGGRTLIPVSVCVYVKASAFVLAVSSAYKPNQA